jgi:hypothetical protein
VNWPLYTTKSRTPGKEIAQKKTARLTQGKVAAPRDL